MVVKPAKSAVYQILVLPTVHIKEKILLKDKNECELYNFTQTRTDNEIKTAMQNI